MGRHAWFGRGIRFDSTPLCHFFDHLYTSNATLSLLRNEPVWSGRETSPSDQDTFTKFFVCPEIEIQPSTDVYVAVLTIDTLDPQSWCCVTFLSFSFCHSLFVDSSATWLFWMCFGDMTGLCVRLEPGEQQMGTDWGGGWRPSTIWGFRREG